MHRRPGPDSRLRDPLETRILGPLDVDLAAQRAVRVDDLGLVPTAVLRPPLELLGVARPLRLLGLALGRPGAQLGRLLLLPPPLLVRRQGPPEEQASHLLHVCRVDEHEAAVVHGPGLAGVPELVVRKLSPRVALAVLHGGAECLDDLALLQAADGLGRRVSAALDKCHGEVDLVEVGVCLELIKRQHRLVKRLDGCGVHVSATGPARSQPQVGVTGERAAEEQPLFQVRAVDEDEAAVVEVLGLAGAPELQVGQLHPGVAVPSDEGLLVHVDDAPLPQGAETWGGNIGRLGDKDRAPDHLEELGVIGHLGEGLQGCLQLRSVHCFLRNRFRRPHLAVPGQGTAELQAPAHAAPVDEDEAPGRLRAGLARAPELQGRELGPGLVVTAEHALLVGVQDVARLQGAHDGRVPAGRLADLHGLHHHFELVVVPGLLGDGVVKL
mmetsp:Transcript_16490/g.51583  ORF Transcript_16490/g.51583 Transcript_16490/m.51583 type:complete len:440 (+) Transcript_16490:736-2055(+)